MDSKQPKPKPIRTRQNDAAAMLAIAAKAGRLQGQVEGTRLEPGGIQNVDDLLTVAASTDMMGAHMQLVALEYKLGEKWEADEALYMAAFGIVAIVRERLGLDRPKAATVPEDTWSAAMTETFRAYGLDDLADLYLNDKDTFHRRYMAGCKKTLAKGRKRKAKKETTEADE